MAVSDSSLRREVKANVEKKAGKSALDLILGDPDSDVLDYKSVLAARWHPNG